MEMSQDERVMILQMVADKKVTAEEAAELLKALDAKETDAARRTAEGEPDGQSAAARSSNFGNGLSTFIEDLVDRVTSAVSDVVGPRHEFPTELTGQFAGPEVPLRISTGNGRVEIHSWDHPGFRATVLVKTRGGSEEEARQRAREAYLVKADETGFDLEARRTDWGDTSVNVTLMVPRDRRYRLEVRSGNGAVELADLQLVEGRVTTGNGRVVIRGGQTGPLVLKSGNGSIEVESDISDLEAGSGNGSVSLRPVGSRSQNLRLSTGNGSIRIDTHRVGPTAGLKVEAHTGMGSVNLSVPNMVYDREIRSMGHKHVIARSNGFDEAPTKVVIHARTGMGSVTVE